jgi:hypothetical protein
MAQSLLCHFRRMKQDFVYIDRLHLENALPLLMACGATVSV